MKPATFGVLAIALASACGTSTVGSPDAAVETDAGIDACTGPQCGVDAGDAGLDSSVADGCIGTACGPTVQITSPSPGEVTPAYVTLAFDVGPGTSSVECRVDGALVACAAPSASFSVPDGTHDATVQAFDAALTGGPIASVTWNVDALPPVILGVQSTPLAPGSVSITFTLADASAIVGIACAIDSEAAAPCGSGTSGSLMRSGLSSGGHSIEIYASDVWGNTGAGVAATGAPGAHVTYPFSVP